MITGPLASYLIGFLTSGGGVTHKKKGDASFYVQSTDKQLMQALAWDARSKFNHRVSWEEDKREGWEPLYRLVLNAKVLPFDLLRFPRRPSGTTPWVIPPTDVSFFIRGLFEGKGGNLSSVQKVLYLRDSPDPVHARTLTVVFSHLSKAVIKGLKLLLSEQKIFPTEGVHEQSTTYFLRLSQEPALEFLRSLYGGPIKYYSGKKRNQYKVLDRARVELKHLPGKLVLSTVRVKSNTTERSSPCPPLKYSTTSSPTQGQGSTHSRTRPSPSFVQT